jgi:glutamyl-tRNA reductase
MRVTTLIDDALSLTMGTTGIMFELHETISIDYKIDELDDARREVYIKTCKEAIERLKKFAEQFQDKTFSNWVNRYSTFLENDLKKQLYYEELSDQLRDKLFHNVTTNKERLRDENRGFEIKLFEKSFKEERCVG